jgi:GTP-dependent dephospho-CoA kinase
MHASPDDLQKLKNPFGELVHDHEISKARILGAIRGAIKIVTVGDATTERLVSFGIIPDVSVVDGRERRSVRDRQIRYPAKQFQCVNPPGTITPDALDVLQQALKESRPATVNVAGEEDMLALPLFHFAPIGSVVLYGQPLEGLVVVKITVSKQKEAKALMDRIMRNPET